MIFRLNEYNIRFPDPSLAEPDGLLAIGGDLRSERLIEAYRTGIFPWYNDETPILWYSPHDRFVLFPNELKVSKSLAKVIRSRRFSITHNRAFPEVISACAAQPRRGQVGTWITSDMQQAYISLHRLGHAHSVEVWYEGKLAGGLYGVAVGRVFCGESMFSRISDASKVALYWLCRSERYDLIDCQVYTNHLASLGARLIARKEYLRHLSEGQ